MSLKNFLFDRAVIAGVLFTVIAGGIVLYKTAPSQSEIQSQLPPPATVQSLSWVYEPADSLTPDGVPQTNLYVQVAYSDGTTDKKLVDTVPMSCNDLDSSVPDSALLSKEAQCYAAGLGYRYKITKGDSSYLVQRKAFEEALPDQVPVTHDYHVISEISFDRGI